MTQGGKVILDAVAAFAGASRVDAWHDVAPPEMPSLAESPRRRPSKVVIPIHRRFDARPWSALRAWLSPAAGCGSRTRVLDAH